MGLNIEILIKKLRRLPGRMLGVSFHEYDVCELLRVMMPAVQR